MAPKNYYKLLGLKDFASIAEVKKAYRAMAFKYHPDHDRGGKSGSELFLQIKEAYDYLKNPVNKRNYDARLRATHTYAPSYGFGKYGNMDQVHQQAQTEVAKKAPDKNGWMEILKPVVLILITIGLMFLMMKPPHWLKNITGNKQDIEMPKKP
jgi:DnaJ-class molecular chaperone